MCKDKKCCIGTGFNGWYNKETWLVKLWIDNDEGLHDNVISHLKQCEEETQTQCLKEYIEEYINEYYLSGASLAVDLLNCALSVVDWEEVKNSLLES